MTGALVAVNLVEGVLPGLPHLDAGRDVLGRRVMAANVLLVVRAALAVTRPA